MTKAMCGLIRDLRFGVRVLVANPGLTATAVLTLALGIAVNTTVFSWIDSVLLHPLPGVRDSARIAVLETVAADGEHLGASYRDFRDYRDSLRLISGIAASRGGDAFTVGEGDGAHHVWGELVSGNFFDVLGVPAHIGRVFGPEEYGDAPGAHPVVVISYSLWKSRFQGDPRIVGKTIRVNRYDLTVIGVAPPNFHGTFTGLSFSLWAPLTMSAQLKTLHENALVERGARGLSTFVRLKPGVGIERARAEVFARSRELAQTDKWNHGFTATLLPVWQAHKGAQSMLRAPLPILMAVCLLVLLIVTANVANLLLARSVARRREFGIRMALGAGRRGLARLVLAESAILTGAGAVAGALVALWLESALFALIPPTSAPLWLETPVRASVLGFMILVCAVAAFVSGSAPVMNSIRPDLHTALKEGGRSETPGAASQRIRGLLVVAEVALAVVTLVGAGLFTRSFRAARMIHPGFDAKNVLVASFYPSANGYGAEEQVRYFDRLRERMLAVPGVLGVAYADRVPLWFGGGPWANVEVEGYVPGPGEDLRVRASRVTPGYFDLLKIRLLHGRDFTERDEPKSEPVVIVNATFAQKYFGRTDAVGRKVSFWNRSFRVVGVVADSRNYSVTEPARPFYYVPYRQTVINGTNAGFFVRTAGDPNRMIPVLRRAAAAVDPDLAVETPMPLEEYTSACLYGQKVAATLLGALGAIALLLSTVGLYSVISYAVNQRTHEMGIRMAIGASASNVLGMVLRQAMGLTFAGLAVGIAAALVAARLVSGELIRVSAADPLTYAAAAVFLSAVALVAGYLPARRATRVDPMVALRCQ